jgi:hypothetical protein
MPRIELERVEVSEDLSQVSSESFDRLAFAHRAVALVRPPRTTVAICDGARSVRLDSGRAWGGGHGARWAVLSVPQDASRSAIAHAVLGLADASSKPFALDLLMSSCADG